MRKPTLLIPFLLAGCSVFAWSQQADKTMSEKPMSGHELFQVYCASCHGADGKGGGPVAPSLRAPMPDLTTLSQRHGGKFPLIRVEEEIQADNFLAHGNREMPVYGDFFRTIRRDEPFVKQRIGLLTGYLQTMQTR